MQGQLRSKSLPLTVELAFPPAPPDPEEIYRANAFTRRLIIYVIFAIIGLIPVVMLLLSAPWS